MKRAKRAIMLTVGLVALLATSPAHAAGKLIYGVFWGGCQHSCEGFKAAIAESGFDAEVLVRDPEQDRSRLPGLVEEARALRADLIVTYGTTATLDIAGTLDDGDKPGFVDDIPVVFLVVADPFGTRIAESLDGSGRTNVTGTFNRVPESVNVEVILAYDPTFDKLGLLFNSNERNSVLKKEELEALSESMDFELVALELDPGNEGTPDPATIPLRMAELRELGVRWMYLGSSSFLRVNGALYTAAAVENGIAVVSPYENLVREDDALLSIAADLFDVGKLAARQALRILRDGAVPGELPLAVATDFAYVVNMDVARRLDRFPPLDFMQVAETVQ